MYRFIPFAHLKPLEFDFKRCMDIVSLFTMSILNPIPNTYIFPRFSKIFKKFQNNFAGHKILKVESRKDF